MKKKPSSSRRRKKVSTNFKDEMIYFEGKVIETFPGTVFGVEILRKNDLPPLFIKASLKSFLKKRRLMIIKGDKVRVEVNPLEITPDTEVLKGTVVERMMTDNYRPPVINNNKK